MKTACTEIWYFISTHTHTHEHSIVIGHIKADLNITAEVVDLARAGVFQVEVGPAEQQFLWRQFHQILKCLSIPQQCRKS